MFSLDKIECKCTKVSTNAENLGKGGDTRLGLSMYFEFQASNETLDMFDRNLRPALYAPDAVQDDALNYLPVLKFNDLAPLSWKYVGLGYAAELHSEVDFGESFSLDDCKVDKITFACKSEGVVVFGLRIYSHPDLDQVGRLCAMVKHNVTLSLVPPKVSDTAPAASDEEESPQTDMLADVEKAETDVLYPKAVAIVRATKNPNTQALMTELRCSINDAARMLQRMVDEGVIVLDGDEYVFAEDAAA